jgi:hypothetical protein
MERRILWVGCGIVLLWAGLAGAAANYDEASVGTYALPELLVKSDGGKVATAKEWMEQRRPEILQLFERQVYGRAPGRPEGMVFKVRGIDAKALGGVATRKEITVYFAGKEDGPSMDLLLYIPNAAKHPVPAFLGMNFSGNQTIQNDPGIMLSTRWVRGSKEMGIVNDRATEESRGKNASRWPVEMILKRGYAVATVYYGDIEPDFNEGWKDGVRGYYLKQQGKTEFAPDDWGAIAAWAWGLSRAMDYLATDPDIDAKRVAVHGHSRLGKTALWAGAKDERFAIVISNDSGEGGAAIARRNFGETVADLNRSFPHWFCGAYKQYSADPGKLPVDAHELIALAAPRAVYVASATEDRWADPKGEFLAAKNAEPAFALFGKEGLGTETMPAADRPVGKTIGYHLRTGPHDITAYDWEQYLNFADRTFSR